MQLADCMLACAAMHLGSSNPLLAYHIFFRSHLTPAVSPAAVSPRCCRPCGPRRLLWRTWIGTEPGQSAAQVSADAAATTPRADGWLVLAGSCAGSTALLPELCSWAGGRLSCLPAELAVALPPQLSACCPPPFTAHPTPCS